MITFLTMYPENARVPLTYANGHVQLVRDRGEAKVTTFGTFKGRFILDPPMKPTPNTTEKL